MAGNDRSTHVHPILVREGADVLDPARLGAVLRGVAAVVPARAGGEYQHQRVGASVRCDYYTVARRSGSRDRVIYEVWGGEERCADGTGCRRGKEGALSNQWNLR